MSRFSPVFCAALIPFMACAGDAFAQPSDIIPLPKTTIETTAIVGGKVKQQKQEDCLGMFALPYNTHPGSRHPVPPVGFREETRTELLQFRGKMWPTTRIHWTVADPNGITNFKGQAITTWVSKDVASPEFRIPLRGGPDLCLPESTLKFEYIPKKPNIARDGSAEMSRQVTVTGQYDGNSNFVLERRKHTAFRYSYKVKTDESSINGELWLSKAVPGGVYRLTFDVTGDRAGTFKLQVKAIQPEELRADLLKVEEGGFAFAVPDSWRQVDAMGESEVLRLLPEKTDKALNRAITVEVKSADGKDYQQWAAILSKDDSRYGLSESFVKGLADSPTFNIDHWSGSQDRVRSYTVGTVRNNRLYLLSHWQDGVAPDSYAGEKAIQQLANSWRWLSRTDPTSTDRSDQ